MVLTVEAIHVVDNQKYLFCFRLQEQRDQGSEGRLRRVRGSRHGQRGRRKSSSSQAPAGLFSNLIVK